MSDNRIMKKLRSEKGASISFALLLFLVCAVVGSVILTAATAAAGRVSRLAESDQRYYSVTSAAELFKKEFDGAAATIVETTTSGVIQTFNYRDEITGTTDLPETTRVTVNGEEITSLSPQIPGTIFDQAAWTLITGDGSGGPMEERTLVLQPQTTGRDGLKVRIDQTLTGDGRLTLYLQNDTGAAAGADLYRLCMVFEADRRTDTDTRTIDSTPEDVGSSAYRITRTTTVTATTEVTWKLADIRTVTGTE